MTSSQLEYLIVFTYFSIKSVFFYRYLGAIKSGKGIAFASLATTLLSLAVDYFLQEVYREYSSLSIGFEGWVSIPPFFVIYILADLISSIFLALYVKFFAVIKTRVFIIETLRLIFLYFGFTILASQFWFNSVLALNPYDYWCVNDTVRREVAEYYFSYETFPGTEEEVIQVIGFSVNPLNGAHILASYNESGELQSIQDDAGNVIVDIVDLQQMKWFVGSEQSYFDLLSDTSDDGCIISL